MPKILVKYKEVPLKPHQFADIKRPESPTIPQRRDGHYAVADYLTEELRKELEEKTGLNLNTLITDETSVWRQREFRPKLETVTNVYDPENPLDMIKILAIKSYHEVANSEKEDAMGKWPDSKWVLIEEGMEDEEENKMVAMRQIATQKFLNLSPADKRALVTVLTERSMKDVSDAGVNVEGDKFIQKDPSTFLRYIEMDQKELNIRSLIMTGLTHGVLTREAGKVKFHDVLIGIDMRDAVEFFQNDENQKIQLRVMEMIEAV
jgi:hypothetical protein